jgi:hypothetical protein
VAGALDEEDADGTAKLTGPPEGAADDRHRGPEWQSPTVRPFDAQRYRRAAARQPGSSSGRWIQVLPRWNGNGARPSAVSTSSGSPSEGLDHLAS